MRLRLQSDTKADTTWIWLEGILGTVEEVIKATKECIRQASRGGGHFIGSSSEIVPATPVENILAFYRTVHECGKYPIRI
ncbi:hypothetical protein FJZ31_35630 [Candidatus Poribacteria bacterium]|nr:hypothetical protein [Candidatus Poribacteria bacterium]